MSEKGKEYCLGGILGQTGVIQLTIAYGIDHITVSVYDISKSIL
jgi:hypothetical protein